MDKSILFGKRVNLRQVFFFIHFYPCISEHLDTFLILQYQRRLKKFEWFSWILTVNRCYFCLAPINICSLNWGPWLQKCTYSLISQSLEYWHKQLSNYLYHFMIMVLESHFNVKTNKLCQMPMCIWIFSTKHWNNFKYILLVTQFWNNSTLHNLPAPTVNTFSKSAAIAICL